MVVKCKNLFLIILSLLVIVSCGTREDEENVEQKEGEELNLKMVTSWPKDFPGLGIGANYFANLVEEMTAGKIKIKVFGAGELVGGLEVFDAVSSGTAELGHSASYYWRGKAPAAVFFTSVPFGLTAQEISGWIYHGGGLELWEELYEEHNLIPLSVGSTGAQMGGWFNKEIKSIKDLKGLKMRIPALAADTLKSLGGIPIILPGGEIFAALESGAVDAVEWVGPYNDLAFGFYKFAKFYYYPGWHEPGSSFEVIVNLEVYDKLSDANKAILKAAAQAAASNMTSDFEAKNQEALEVLVNEHGVVVKKFPDQVLKELHEASLKVLEQKADEDPKFAKVYQSYKAYREKVIKWTNLSEKAFIDARNLVQ